MLIIVLYSVLEAESLYQAAMQQEKLPVGYTIQYGTFCLSEGKSAKY